MLSLHCISEDFKLKGMSKKILEGKTAEFHYINLMEVCWWEGCGIAIYVQLRNLRTIT